MTRRTGRPTRREARARTAHFLQLIADGKSGRDAARQAGVSLERALDIATTDQFAIVVAAIRSGQVDAPVAAFIDTTAPTARAA